jgi:hypothetical protein
VCAVAQQVARGVVLPADDLVGCVVAVLLHELPIVPQSGAVAELSPSKPERAEKEYPHPAHHKEHHS